MKMAGRRFPLMIDYPLFGECSKEVRRSICPMTLPRSRATLLYRFYATRYFRSAIHCWGSGHGHRRSLTYP